MTDDLQASNDRRIRQIVIVGGGTAGWLVASMLARVLNHACLITLVESKDIPSVGVGEATIPPFVDLLALLGIDEKDFVRHTEATYKLGIRFDDWLRPGSSYWHPFGTFGQAINRRPFFHAWHRARQEGFQPSLEDYSACVRLGEARRFLGGAEGARAGVKHALHFDAGLVAQYLRAYAGSLGVQRIERTVAGVSLREDGFIEAVQFDEGDALVGDLFIDCSGFRAVLIGQAMNTGWVDWSGLLPCDRAIVAPAAVTTPSPPFTRAVAQTAGWRWSIPLRHRTGNGYVFCGGAMAEAAAEGEFAMALGEAPLAQARMLRFSAGRRERFWVRNCVAVGLASGFLEPLESTSIHLAVRAISALLEHFPDRDFHPATIASCNAALIEEIDRARDFIFLHYHLSERTESKFWRQMRETPMPDSLAERVELYRESGRIVPQKDELFSELSWFYVFDGMGVRPRACDPLIYTVPKPAFATTLSRLAAETKAKCRLAAMHDAVLPG